MYKMSFQCKISPSVDPCTVEFQTWCQTLWNYFPNPEARGSSLFHWLLLALELLFLSLLLPSLGFAGHRNSAGPPPFFKYCEVA